MILVDSNVFMYAAGSAHANKEPSVRFLRRIGRGEVQAGVDAEVLQEILHRYRAIKRWADGKRVYDLARKIVPLVVPVTAETLDEARLLLDRYDGLVARDAVHAAVVRLGALDAICSYDRAFDRVEGVVRIEP